MEPWVLLLACGAATYLWRGPGVLLSASIDARSAVFTWVACVAYAIIAGVVARMLLMPTGELAGVTAAERAIGSAVALAVYFGITERNLFAGTLAGATALWLMRMLP